MLSFWFQISYGAEREIQDSDNRLAGSVKYGSYKTTLKRTGAPSAHGATTIAWHLTHPPACPRPSLPRRADADPGAAAAATAVPGVIFLASQ